MLVALGFAGLLIFGIGDTVMENRGLEEANADGNVQGLANLIFSRYVFAFEATSALLITAAVGRDGARTPRAHRAPARPSASAPRSASAAATPHRCPAPASTRATTPSTPRPCCPTARPADVSVSRVLVARGDVRDIPGGNAEAVRRAELARKPGDDHTRDVQEALEPRDTGEEEQP